MRLLHILVAVAVLALIMYADTLLGMVAKVYGPTGQSLALRLALLSLAVPALLPHRPTRAR